MTHDLFIDLIEQSGGVLKQVEINDVSDLLITPSGTAHLFRHFGLQDTYQVMTGLNEAAKLDGANQFTQLFKVTLPQIKPQIIFLVVNIISTSLAGNMNLVLPFYGVSSEKTLVMGTYVYYYANNKNQLGYSNAAAVLLMLISFVLCYALNNTLTKEEK